MRVLVARLTLPWIVPGRSRSSHFHCPVLADGCRIILTNQFEPMRSAMSDPSNHYRGRLAPSPTGLLHLGHARTFWIAQERAEAGGGVLILRNEDLDPDRCKPEFLVALIEDLKWFGFRWAEGPDVGGGFGPYNQSERRRYYVEAFRRLWDAGLIYPCRCSRREVQQSTRAPHAAD